MDLWVIKGSGCQAAFFHPHLRDGRRSPESANNTWQDSAGFRITIKQQGGVFIYSVYNTVTFCIAFRDQHFINKLYWLTLYRMSTLTLWTIRVENSAGYKYAQRGERVLISLAWDLCWVDRPCLSSEIRPLSRSLWPDVMVMWPHHRGPVFSIRRLSRLWQKTLTRAVWSEHEPLNRQLSVSGISKRQLRGDAAVGKKDSDYKSD